MVSVVFLQLELSGYFLASVEAFVQQHKVPVHIFRLPVNKEAPFEISVSDGVTLYDRFDYTGEELMAKVKSLNPAVVLCSGWVDKDYLDICKTLKRTGVKTVMSLDNHWHGNLKQLVLKAISPFWLKRIFAQLWVPGQPQQQYAQHLGFKGPQVKTGYYCCDTPLFEKLFEDTFPAKTSNYPKRFLYVGRYVDFKGVWDLWNAFKQLRATGSDWELWCAGTGDLADQAPTIDGLKHWGFVQPEAMKELVANCGVYILPSHKEPWAVTVHEYALAGMPMICSDQVGAASAFIKPENGWVYRAGNESELFKVMKQATQLSSEQLVEMGNSSHQIGRTHDTKKWADTLKSFMD